MRQDLQFAVVEEHAAAAGHLNVFDRDLVHLRSAPGALDLVGGAIPAPCIELGPPLGEQLGIFLMKVSVFLIVGVSVMP